MSDPDTGAGTPLTADERAALDAVLAVVGAAAASEFAPFMDSDRVDAFLGAMAAVDPPLTVRPATDPAGLAEARAQVFAEIEKEVRRRMHGGIWLSEPLMLQLIKKLSGRPSTPSR